MKTKEGQRVAVLQHLAQGALTAEVAAEVLGVSLRQMHRLLAAYRQDGADAIRHGNQGRQPAHTTPAELRQRVITLIQTTVTTVTRNT